MRPPTGSEEEALARRIASQHTSPWAALRWALTRRKAKWPRWVESPTGPTPPPRVESGLRYTVVNHSSVLLQVDACNLLVDPIWSRRCSPVSWAGPLRVRPPGLRMEDLPPIDLVLLSHNHYDHLDVATLERLCEEHDPVFVAAAGDGSLLRRIGIERVEEVRWWQRLSLAGLPPLVFVPALHFSGRGATDRNRSLWGGYVVETSLGKIYFCGDSGYGSLFRELGRRMGPMRLSFLPIGAYRPRWFMGPVHVDPLQAAQIHLDVGSRRSVAIHHGTFQLTDEGIEEPILELEAARRRLGIDPRGFEATPFGAEVWLDR